MDQLPNQKMSFANPEPRTQAHRPVGVIVTHLQATAEIWVPQLLPGGKRVGGKWRCGGLDGSRARKNGSLVVELHGHRAGLWIDWGTDEGGGPLALIANTMGVSYPEAVRLACDLTGLVGEPPPEKVRMVTEPPPPPTRAIEQILSVCGPIDGTQAEAYLKGRALRGPFCRSLQYHPGLRHTPSETTCPAMVAIASDIDGKTVGIHRTYLREAQKADLEPNRMTLGQVASGSAVRLALADKTLGIAEGIESALAAMQMFGVPTWAALSTSGVRNFAIPAKVSNLIIFEDSGRAGGKAAAQLEVRAKVDGKKVTRVKPRHGDDFNDDLLREVGTR